MKTEGEDILLLASERIRCRRCNARSKRTKDRCRAPAIKGKTKCYYHGGRSTGAKTAEGKARTAAANTTHGQYTLLAQTQRREASVRLSQLEDAMHILGMSTATRIRGRKATGYCQLTSLDGVLAWLPSIINGDTS